MKQAKRIIPTSVGFIMMLVMGLVFVIIALPMAISADAPDEPTFLVKDTSGAVVQYATVYAIPSADVEALAAQPIAFSQTDDDPGPGVNMRNNGNYTAASKNVDEPLEDLINGNYTPPGGGVGTYQSATTDEYGMAQIPGIASSTDTYFIYVKPATSDTGHLPGGSFARVAASGVSLDDKQTDITVSTKQSATATFTGSSSCLGCHGDKSTVGQTAHKNGIMVPGSPSGLQDISKFDDDDGDYDSTKALDTKFTETGTTVYFCDYDPSRKFDKFETYESTGGPCGQVWATVKTFKDPADGKYKMTFTNVINPLDPNSTFTKDVELTYGGGVYKQRYMTTAGNSIEVMPLQFNQRGTDSASERTRKVWRDYHLDWWITTNTVTISAVDPVNDSLTATAHGLSNNDKVAVATPLPAPLVGSKAYYAIVVDANTVKLAETSGGAAVDITGTTTGGKIDVTARVKTPTFRTDATSTHPNPASNNSFDTQCAMCHMNGYTLTKGADGQYTSTGVADTNGEVNPISGQHQEMNIGCETCHGPGSEHIAQGGAGKSIVTPQNTTPERELTICLQCHSRPQGNDSYGIKKDGPLNTANKMMLAGTSRADFLAQNTSRNDASALEVTNNARDYWPDQLHQKSHHDQGTDFIQTSMFRNGSQLVTCDSCHGIHGPGTDRNQLSGTSDDSLCATCHADVNSSDHQIDKSGYDMGATCVECHNVKTSSSGAGNNVTGAYPHGDISSHLFDVPNKTQVGSAKMPVAYTNSCGSCHWPLSNAPVAEQPLLSLNKTGVYWASYADYTARNLSVDFNIANQSAGIAGNAYGVQLVGTINTSGVTSVNTPLPAGHVPAGYSAARKSVVKYNVPVGAAYFSTTVYATATDGANNSHAYPGPIPAP